MRNMNRILLPITTLMLVSVLARADSPPTQFRTDSILFGKGGSTANKSLKFDFGLGASNPALSADSSNNLLYNKNAFWLGDGLSSAKTFIANIGAGANNPKIKFDTTANEWQSSADGTNFDSFGSGSGSGSGINLLKNPGFESGIAQGWTNTGGTFAAVSGGSNLLIGKGSATFTASAGSQSIQSTLYPVPVGLQGQNCAASVMYKGGDSGLKFQAIDNSSNVLATQTIVASTGPQTINLTFVCPSSGSIQVKLVSSASSAIIAVDQMFLGSNSLIALSQAQYVGSMSITNCTGATSWTSVGYNDNTSGGTACTYNSTGSLSAPSGAYMGFRAALTAGEYLIILGHPSSLTSGGTVVGTRISDGTHHSKSPTKQLAAGTGAQSVNSNDSYTLTVTNALPAADFRLQVNMGSGTYVSDDSGTDQMTFDVYRFPTSDQQAVKPDQSALSWSGTIAGNTALTSAVEANFPGATSITERSNRNMGSVAVAAVSNGVLWTPSKSGMWKVCANGFALTSGAGATGAVVMTDGADVHLGESQYFTQAIAGGDTPFSRCSTFNVVSLGSSYTTKIRGLVDSGSIRPINVEWTIENLDSAVSAPILVNSVVTPLAGVMNIVTVAFAGDSGETVACSSDPCVITRQSGGVTAVNWLGAGDYDIHFTAGMFSSPPICTGMSMDLAQVGVVDRRAPFTNTIAYLYLAQANTGAGLNDGMHVICIGPK